MTFNFQTVAIPQRAASPGRPAGPNPFADQVAELIESDGTPRDVAVTFVTEDDPESPAVNTIKRQLARAGVMNGVSVFKHTEENPTGGTRVTFWTHDRIIPKRKPKDAESNGHALADGDDGRGADDGS